MIITAAYVQRLRDLAFPVECVLAGAQLAGHSTTPGPYLVVHGPDCPDATGLAAPAAPLAPTAVYATCPTCESYDPDRPPFSILRFALHQVDTIARRTTEIHHALHRDPTPELATPTARLVLAAERDLAGVCEAFAAAFYDHDLPLEAFFAALAAAVTAARDAFRTWLISGFAFFDPASPERYLLLRDGSPTSNQHCLAAVAAFDVVAQAGLWTVIQAPNLTTTTLFDRDALYSAVADLGPVGEGLPPAAWAAFTAASPQAGTTLAEQCELVNALRAACAA